MDENWMERVAELIQAKQFGQAITILKVTIAEDPTNWNAWYLIGQCFRYLNEFDSAVECLIRAHHFATDQRPSVLLALGIAYQLQGELDEAVKTLESALSLDPNHVTACNSLALTYKRLEQYEKSIETYERGVQALTRKFVHSLENNASNKIIKHVDTPSNLWTQYASWGALYLVRSLYPASTRLLLPTSISAADEEQKETHKGLYWTEQQAENGECSCYVLPNFFNTYREHLRGNNLYATLTANRGLVLELVGRNDEAKKHFYEASYFES